MIATKSGLDCMDSKPIRSYMEAGTSIIAGLLNNLLYAVMVQVLGFPPPNYGPGVSYG